MIDLSKQCNSIEQYIYLGNEHFLKGQYNESLICYRRALRLDRTSAVIYYNIANILALQSKFEPAERHYKEALRYKKDFPEAYNNLGNVLKEQGKISEAIKTYREAIRLKNDFFEAFNGLGNALQAEGLIDEAISAYQKAIEINPAYHVAQSNMLLSLNYTHKLSPQDVFKEHLKVANSIEQRVIRERKPPYKKSRDKVKIGYLSPDFRRHSVGFFILPVIKYHDRDKFKIYCYSDVRVKDRFTEEIVSVSDIFVDCVNMTDIELYQKINDDEIEILFDLAGHSGYNRLTLFAMRPSPIQITWIGYPNTTGLKAIDYRIVDSYTDPIGMTESLNTERLIRMPECFLCYSPPRDAPPIDKTPLERNGYITFGSFHNLSKINDYTLDLWSRVLKVNKRSKILLKSKTFIDDNLKSRFLSRFKNRGIDEDRLIILSHVKDFREHLSLYNQIDISLDCFPYNGTTTTFESIFMGVPVVTMAGNSHVSRVGLSILSNLDMIELIAKDEEHFVNIISNMLLMPEKVIHLKKTLREQLLKSTLVDSKRFTRKFEDTLKHQLSLW